MMKLIKSWNAVKPGDRYASTMPEGYEVPEEIQPAAIAAGVVLETEPNRKTKRPGARTKNTTATKASKKASSSKKSVGGKASGKKAK